MYVRTVPRFYVLDAWLPDIALTTPLDFPKLHFGLGIFDLQGSRVKCQFPFDNLPNEPLNECGESTSLKQVPLGNLRNPE